MNMRKAISLTLSHDNLLWLKGQATRTAKGSISEVLDGIVREARKSGGAQRDSVRSVANTIDLPEDDPNLEQADGYIRALFAGSARQPIMVRERKKSYGGAKGRRG